MKLDQKNAFSGFAKNFRRPWMKLKIFFCQFPNTWALRVSGMGGYTSKCEKKSKSLHPNVHGAFIFAVRNVNVQWCISVLSQQSRHAGCIPFHRQPYRHAGCILLHLQAMFLNAEMPECRTVLNLVSLVPELIKILMPEAVRYRNMGTQSGTGMLWYRNETLSAQIY